MLYHQPSSSRRLSRELPATFLLVLWIGWAVGCGPPVYTPRPSSCVFHADCPGRLLCRQGQCVAASIERAPEQQEEGVSEPPRESAEDVPERELPLEADGGPNEPPPETSCEDQDNDGFCKTRPDPQGRVDCNDQDKQIFPEAPERCNGVDDDCDGKTDEALTAPPCRRDTGVCQGATMTCKGKEGWKDCTESDYLVQSGDYEVKEKTCDGKDNDCDGSIDNNIEFPTIPCEVPNKDGECARGTYTACQQGKLICTSSVQPSPEEVCNNGKDEDCDGKTDENPPCVCEAGKQEPCYQALQGCRRRNDGTYQCQGLCKAGMRTCQSGGNWGPCTGETPPAVESCDGKDNNCDGNIDETDPGGGQNCTTMAPGICKDGRTRCTNGQVTCVSLRQPVAETCNNQDDDCDGAVDNNVQQQGQTCQAQALGACSNGTYSCVGGSLRCDPGQPSAEVCDGKDNDCDGLADNTTGTSKALQRSCYGGNAATLGQGICVDGVQTCANGAWGACTGATTPQTREVCADDKDNNCDGDLTDSCSCTPNKLSTLLASSGEHRKPITSLVISPDDAMLATASNNGEMRLWSHPGGLLRWSWQGHARPILDIAISSDSKLLVSGDNSGGVKLWDLSQRRLLRTLPGATGEIVGVRFIGKDRQVLAATSDSALYTWSISDGTLIRRDSLNIIPTGLDHDPSGERVALAGSRGEVALWSLKTHKSIKMWNAHTGKTLSIAFSSSYKEVASGGADATVHIWDAAQNPGKKRFSLSNLRSDVLDLHYDAQGGFLFAGMKHGEVYTWRLPTYTFLFAYKGLNATAHSVQTDNSAKRIYAAGDAPRTASWAIGTSSATPDSFPAHSRFITTLSFSGRAGFVASGDERGVIQLWKPGHPPGATELLLQHQATISGLQFNADGKLLISADRDGFLIPWDIASPKALYSVKPHNGSPIFDLATSPTNADEVATVGGDKQLVIWSINNKKSIAKASTNEVPSSVDIAPAGTQIAIGTGGGNVYLWSYNNGRLSGRQSLEEHNDPVRVVRYGRASSGTALLASADSKGRIVLWDPSTGKAQIAMDKTGGIYVDVQFDQAGKLLFALDTNRDEIDLWEISTKKLLTSIKAPGNVSQLLWTPGLKQLWVGVDTHLERWGCP